MKYIFFSKNKEIIPEQDDTGGWKSVDWHSICGSALCFFLGGESCP